MDELWEAISWAQLGYHAKPVGLLNAAGFYNDLIAFNRRMIEVGFIRPAHAGIMIVDAGIDELLDKMEAYQPHEPIFALTAEDLELPTRSTEKRRIGNGGVSTGRC